MISSIPLGKQLGNEIIRYPMHTSFLFHHSNLQLAYTTQACILKFKTCGMQENIWNAHSNATYKFMSLLPLLVCSNFNWSPYFHISAPMSSFHYLCALLLHLYLNDHKGSILDRLRLSMSINGVRIIFPNLVQSRSFAKYI